jgi:hypothetical protein
MLLPREAPSLLSIVIPMHNEEQVFPLLREQLGQAIGERQCGVAVAIMDADLPDPPSLILEMIRGYCEGHDAVYGDGQHGGSV